MNDDPIRSVLSPLRAHETSPDIDRLVTQGRRARQERQRRRAVGTVAVTAAAIGIAFAGLPADESDAPRTAGSILRAAAAAAADQPPEKLTGIRYTKVDYRILLQPHDGSENYQFNRVLEFWVRRDASSRTEFAPAEFEHLDGRPHPGPHGSPPVGAGRNDEAKLQFLHLDVENLSTDPATARDEIEAASRRWWKEFNGGAPPEDVVPEMIVRSCVDLLGFASITPEQRKTVFEVLAALPGGKATGESEVELDTVKIGKPTRITLRIDPGTGALRSYTERPGVEPFGQADRVEESFTFEVSRDVAAVGERP